MEGKSNAMARIGFGVDFIFNKLLPKKFIVFIVSTVLVATKTEVPQEYWYILMVYIGGNVIKGFATAINNKEK